MAKIKSIAFGEFRRLLNRLGYTDKRTDKFWVFHHPQQGIQAFRLYQENEPVSQGDLLVTRRFLDARGLLDKEDFDTFLEQATTPA